MQFLRRQPGLTLLRTGTLTAEAAAPAQAAAAPVATAKAAALPQLTRQFVTNHADNPHINYLRCPVRSIAQIQRLMRQVYRGLGSIRIPSLIIHADGDPKVDVQSGRDIYRAIGASAKRYREIRFNQHGIVRGAIAQQVFAEVGAFLNTLPG